MPKLATRPESHLDRCSLKGRAGDAANAILSVAGYNFRRILAWPRFLTISSALNPAYQWTIRRLNHLNNSS
jgi:hypothetical protein